MLCINKGLHACGNCGCLWITVNAVSAILRIIFGQFAHDFREQKMFWKIFGNCWKKYWKDTGNCWKKYLKNTGNCCQKYWKNTGNWWGKYWKILEFHIWNVVGTLSKCIMEGRLSVLRVTVYKGLVVQALSGGHKCRPDCQYRGSNPWPSDPQTERLSHTAIV